MQNPRVPGKTSADDARADLAAVQWLQARDDVARQAVATFGLVIDVVRASLHRQSGAGLQTQTDDWEARSA